jgi:hypothetical protein
MAQGMRADAFRNASSPRSFGQRLLHDRLMKVIPGRRSESRIATDARRREHELPSPLCRSVGIFAIQRKRQNDPSESVGEIPFMLPFDVLQIGPEPLLDGYRQHRHPILLTFASAHSNLMLVKIEVLHAKLQTLLQPQPGPIE